jgi:DNA-binding response OmpR family regulator/signal transduction histidine kinase
MRVLVAEDHRRLATALAEGLRREGMAVDIAFDGVDALAHAAINSYDVVVLDRDLPGVHGDQVCRTLLGERNAARILMLTAASTISDRVEGLGLGADDYLGKPFDFGELVARIRALARRAVVATPPTFVRGDVSVDPSRRLAIRGARRLALSPKEFAVLEYLLAADGRVVAPAAGLRLPRRTARLRLTLLYAGLFLLSGTCVLVLVYLLVAGTSPLVGHASQGVAVAVPAPPATGSGAPATTSQSATVATPAPSPGPVVFRRDPGADVIRRQAVAQHESDLGRLLAVSWVVLAISAVASALLGWVAAGRVLRPLRSITTTARTISAGNLHERLALSGPDDEFKQLGDTLDDLLARLEASFAAQRRFVANASHELRTPLAVERTLLQVALADPHASAETLRSTCEELLACGAEHERLLEALLTLAGSDGALERRDALDLSTLTEHALQSARHAISRHSLQLETSLSPAPATGDPALVERLVANLIDNAASHNVPGGRVDVRTETDGADAVLMISNTGPPVPPDEIDRLFEPFQRLHGRTSANGDGHFGLGLSIVRAIAVAHDATLTARPRPGGGLLVTVRFH